MQKRGSKAAVKYRILGRRHGFTHLKTKNRDIIKKSAREITHRAGIAKAAYTYSKIRWASSFLRGSSSQQASTALSAN